MSVFSYHSDSRKSPRKGLQEQRENSQSRHVDCLLKSFMRSASGGTGGSVSDLGVGGGSATADRWCQKKDGAVGLGVSGIVRKGGEP